MSIPVTINQGSSVIEGRGEIGPLCPLLPASGCSIVFIKGTDTHHQKSKRQFLFQHHVSGSFGVKKASASTTSKPPRGSTFILKQTLATKTCADS